FDRIGELMSSLDEGARQAGIALLALKGAELHARHLYVAGDRPMADLDLLVHRDQLEPAARLLENQGFRQTFVNTRHQVFEPEQRGAAAELGEHSANPLKIELHSSIAERLPVDCVDITTVIMPRQPPTGLNGYPSRAALLTHLLHHCAGGMTFRGI